MALNRHFPKNFIISLLFFAAMLSGMGLPASAQGRQVNLKLTVYSENDGQTVVGASCMVPDYGIFTLTDADGKARLEKVPVGKATLSVTMLGYEDYNRSFQFSRDTSIVVRLQESSLTLEQVVVTATPSAAGASTASNIGRMAIDHLQATSLADVMQLLPGQLMTSGDMTTSESIAIRSASTTDANNAFGAAVVVDGVPMSDNGSIEKSGDQGPQLSGVDMRQISADNIESVEVIRGIPSVEHGDLTSGAVVVNTKAGYTPVEIRAKVNPTTVNASVGKGWKFTKAAGSLNVNADYARASGDPRSRSRSYDRINGGVTYSNTIGRIWSTTTKLQLSGILDLRPTDPDLLAEGTKDDEKQFTVRASHTGRVSFNKPWSRSFNYALGFSYTDKRSEKTAIVQADGGKPIITALSDGYFQVPYITESYLAAGGTESRPLNFYAKAANTFTVKLEKLNQRFNMGAEYRLESNKARGYFNANDLQPLSPNSNGRPRPYYDIPPLHQIAAYLEDNLDWELPLGMEFKLQAGVRFDMMQPGMPEQVYAFSPRFNASLKLTSWLTLRGGWGLSNKTPGLAYLYPEPNYVDRVAASYLPVDVSKQLVVYNTHITQVERNNTLKNMSSSKGEVGVDLKFKNGMSFSVVAYQSEVKNGFGAYSEPRIFLSNYYTAAQGIKLDGAGNPYIDWANPARIDTVYTTSGRTGNTRASLDRGVEFDFNFGQIKPIRTSILLSGAYMESQSWTTGPNYQSPDGIPAASVYAQGGANTPPFKLLYPSGQSRSVNRRFSANLRLVCNIPRMKMVISLSNQVVFYTYSVTTNLKSDPYGWYDAKMVMEGKNPETDYIPITAEMLADQNYTIKGIPLKDQRRNPKATDPTIQPPIWLMNLRLTKDVSKNFGFSFYVNNAFFYMPYQASSVSTTLTERNTGTFSFGVEMFVKI
ncbi:MAG: TonB-dependent receptor [Bacteroidales bacterium]|nr:TonB-dependent receptor [Bacteroidales bacterium]